MQVSVSDLVHGSILWRVLIAAALISARVTLDDIIPRGRIGRHAGRVGALRRQRRRLEGGSKCDM